MSVEGNLGYGIIKPLIDATGALVTYATMMAFMTTTKDISTITANIGFQFNIWLFLCFFGMVSFIDDAAWQIYSNFKSTYRESIDQMERLLGMLIGMFIFMGPLSLIYIAAGGSVGDAFLSWFISFGFLIFTMWVRSKISESSGAIY